MKKILYTLFATALILTGCYDEEIEPIAEGRTFSSFTASIADIGITRSHLEGGKQVVWDEGNRIGVYSDTEGVKEYIYRESVFSGGSISGNTFYAFYPYEEDAVDRDNKNIIHVNLWAGAGYTADSYNRALPMVAKSTDNNLKFKQTCGLIRFSLKGTNIIERIRLQVNNGEMITGNGIIDMSEDNPVLKMVADEEDTWRSSIDMWPNDLQLKADENTDFYFIVPVGVYEKGLTLYIYGTNPNTNEEFSLEKRTDKEVEVRRAMIKTFTGLDTDVILKEEADEILREREALMDLYNSTDGANWKNNENWGSDKPLSEWYGVGTDRGHVRYLSLYDNGLKGTIPESIGLLTNLADLHLGNNQLSGSIPESVVSLVNLEYLYLSDNQLSGSIPECIGNLKNLVNLIISYNQLSGSIPESIGQLTNMTYIRLENNHLSGSIPESIGNLVNLKYLYLFQNQLTGSIPDSMGLLTNLTHLQLSFNHLSGSIPESIGNLVNLQFLRLGNNQLTGSIPENICKLTSLTDMGLDGNQLTGSIPESIGNLINLGYLYLYNNQLTGSLPESIGNLINLKQLRLSNNRLTGTIPDSFVNLADLSSFSIFDNQMDGILSEKLVKSEWWDKIKEMHINLQQQPGYRLKYGWLYESTDFSADGQVKKWQSHTKGKGITIVITGDAFSDRLITDGTFDEGVKWAIEAFFSIEPYTTFKDYFDVYSVAAVSKNEIIDEDIIFETKNGDDGIFRTNRTTIAEYVRKVPELDGDLKNVTAIILLNRDGANSRANCSWNTDGYSSGLCINSSGSVGTLRHEAGGHGFAKLADEYISDDPTGSSVFADYDWMDRYHNRGWYLNVDYKKDPANVLWKDFIQNHDYDVERIGIYEGALGDYSKGVYRSTKASLMKGSSSSDIFNAPSRWAIYQHIMDLAGESYTFQDFLNYDKKNLERIANEAKTRSYVEKNAENVDVSQLGAPPIIYDYPSSEIGLH
ncbi:MAG: M64 family metallopeptidase [Bacteroidales bacterium]|nr:M64 family metallopeptidase [Bacteroidales bacterium]